MVKSMTYFHAARSCAWGGALVLLTLLAGCDTLPLTAPTDSSLILTASPQDDGTVRLQAFVVEPGGTPVHNGTQVWFTTTYGTVAPERAETVDGVAIGFLTVDATGGLATIRAISGSVTDVIELIVAPDSSSVSPVV